MYDPLAPWRSTCGLKNSNHNRKGAMMELELSEQTKAELKKCYEQLQQELRAKVEDRDVLGQDIGDMQDCIDAINTLIRLSTITIPDTPGGEDG